MLCVKETFLYLNENLKLTPQALSDKATPMDELEDMHQRVSFLVFHCTICGVMISRLPFAKFSLSIWNLFQDIFS